LALGLALLGLLYATLVRQNAFPVTAPVAFFLTWQLLSRRRLPLAALSAVFVVVLGFGNILLTPFWVRNTTDAALSRIYAADLMGISKFARQNLLPDYLCAKQNPLVCIDERYSPVCGDLNFRPLQEPSQCAGWSLPFEETSAHKTDLAHRFSRAVEAHPLAYLRHRAEILAAHLGLKSTKTHLPYYLGYADNPWGYAAVGIVTSFLEERLIRPLSKTAFFEHWPFLVILGALIALLWRHKSQAEAAVFFFAVSAGLGANFFVIPCGDYRYSLWLNIFVFLALGLFLEARSKKEREEKKDIK
jgi:hypothetical protein